MAIATLERLYNNQEVFRGVVKIRKGEAVRLMNTSSDIERVKAVIGYYLNKASADWLHYSTHGYWSWLLIFL